MNEAVKQRIDNCYMVRRYGNPGCEEGMCAGIRTMNGDGEPATQCKECNLLYLHEVKENEIN